ncbi:MAG: hypothetical protein GY878_22490, partial [Fuerstiella sp.]|nr:hypothetical protein [Fuerstiella sp.]
DGKQGGQDGKQGGQDGKQGGQDGKQGGQDGKQGGQDGKQGDQGGKQGDQGGKQGGQDGGKQGGQQAGGDNQAADSNSGPPGGQVNNSADQSSNANHLSKKAPGAGNVQGGPQDGEPNGGGGGGDGDGMFKSDDPNVQDGAQAASMVLKRLQKELERGQVDKELLEELGWTEDQLKSFSDRIQQQLNSLKDESSDDDMTEKLKRRRVEELLKSLDLTSKSGERVGSRTRDREQQDTTSQRRPAPSRYKDWQKMYQKSLTDGRRR